MVSKLSKEERAMKSEILDLITKDHNTLIELATKTKISEGELISTLHSIKPNYERIKYIYDNIPKKKIKTFEDSIRKLILYALKDDIICIILAIRLKMDIDEIKRIAGNQSTPLGAILTIYKNLNTPKCKERLKEMIKTENSSPRDQKKI